MYHCIIITWHYRDHLLVMYDTQSSITIVDALRIHVSKTLVLFKMRHSPDAYLIWYLLLLLLFLNIRLHWLNLKIKKIYRNNIVDIIFVPKYKNIFRFFFVYFYKTLQIYKAINYFFTNISSIKVHLFLQFIINILEKIVTHSLF
jgi:hypothetical protein